MRDALIPELFKFKVEELHGFLDFRDTYCRFLFDWSRFFYRPFGWLFGVGGSFLAGPALFAVGMPMNFVIGTDLLHIVGKSIVATRTHRALGNVDTKLGMIMVVGTVIGVETGAQCIQYLKRNASVDMVVAIGYIVVLVSISLFRAGRAGRPGRCTENSTSIKRKT